MLTNKEEPIDTQNLTFWTSLKHSLSRNQARFDDPDKQRRWKNEHAATVIMKFTGSGSGWWMKYTRKIIYWPCFVTITHW